MLAGLLLPGSESAEVTGTVLDPSGKPVPGAVTILRGSRLAVVSATESDGEGNFAFPGAAAGEYALEVRKPQFAPRRAALHVREGQRLNVVVRLELRALATQVTVSAEAGRLESSDQVSQQVNVISERSIAERAVSTLAEAVAGEAGLAPQPTSASMGGVTVRGLTGRNVAVYFDGVRYTTSAQRGGVSTFFNLPEYTGIDTIEVLHGPNSAQYGSDSLGGAVQLLSHTAAPAPGGKRLHGEFTPVFRSAAWTFGTNLLGSYAGSRAGVVANFAARRNNTIRTGGGIDSHGAVTRFLGLPSSIMGSRLPDTAFTQYGGAVRFDARLSERQQVVARYERGQQDGGKRYDQLLGGDGDLIAGLRNLMLDFGYIRYTAFPRAGLDQVSAAVSYNAQREERVNQGGRGNPLALITHQYERMASWGVNFSGARQLRRHALAAGGEGYRERMASPAFAADPVTGRSSFARPRVPDGALYSSYGFYVQETWEPAAALRLNGALRFSGISYRSPGIPGFVPAGGAATNNLSGRAGAVISSWKPVRFSVQYSRGFRAPNMTDFGTLGLQGNGFYEASPADVAGRGATIGDRADAQAVSTGRLVEPIRPEVSDNIEAGIHLASGRIRSDITGFYASLSDVIVSQTLILPPGAAGLAIGDQTVVRQISSGAVYVPISTNPVQIRANRSGARFRGIEHSLEVRLARAVQLRENVTAIHGADSETGLAPDLEGGVPPLTANFSLAFTPHARRWWIEGYGTAAARQTRLSSLALADRRTGAARSRSDISSFFNRGARVRGLTTPDGRLAATGETLAQVQARVLGALDSAPLFAAVPGYAALGIRGSWSVSERTDLFIDFSNFLDKNYRPTGWGIDAAGRSVTVRYRFRF